jgi:carbon monoxide dehydrogenase subunit G
MKRVVVLVMMLAVGALAQSSNVSGNWELEMSWPEAKSTGTCTFQQEGERLKGTCGGADRFAITGRIEGNRLTWQVEVEQGGASGRMEFSGELDGQGATISGTCSVVGLNRGTFTMKRAR